MVCLILRPVRYMHQDWEIGFLSIHFGAIFCINFFSPVPEILLTQLGSEIGVIGALELAYNRLRIRS